MYSLRKAISIAVIAAFPLGANATLIEADFYTQAHYPDLDFIDAPVVHQAQNRRISADGFELTGGDRVANGTELRGGEVWLDYDPVSDVLTLDSKDRLDFQTLIVDIQNMQFSGGQSVQSFKALGNDLFEEVFSPELTFTANSLRIAFDARPSYFKFSGGTAQFQVGMASVPVPEPGTLGLMALGLGAVLGGARLRKPRA